MSSYSIFNFTKQARNVVEVCSSLQGSVVGRETEPVVRTVLKVKTALSTVRIQKLWISTIKRECRAKESSYDSLYATTLVDVHLDLLSPHYDRHQSRCRGRGGHRGGAAVATTDAAAAHLAAVDLEGRRAIVAAPAVSLVLYVRST
jgi:hypothetical protein